MERKSMSKIIIFMLDGEASPTFVLHLWIWLAALWSQLDWNNCGVFDPSKHTHCKTSRECAHARHDIRSLATNHAIVRAYFYSTSNSANGTHGEKGKVTYDSTRNGIVWEILPAMEDGRFAFHSIICPVCSTDSSLAYLS